MTRSVYVDFKTEGLTLACRGIVRDPRTRQILAEAPEPRPRGMTRAALDDARELIRERGWNEVSVDTSWDNVT